MPYTVWIRLVQAVLNAAEKANLETETLLNAIGLDSSVLQDADARISHEKLSALWQEITWRSGEEAIGLRLASFVEPAAFDVIGYAVDSSPNLGEGLSRLMRYIRLIHEGGKLTLEKKGKVVRITHGIPGLGLPLPGAACQWVLANIVLSSRKMTGLDIVPLKVGFQHQQPEDLSAYQRLFRAPLEFERPVNEIIFEAALLDRPLLRANPGLCAVLDRYVMELLTKLPQQESIVDSVRREIGVGLRGGDPGLEAIAKKLGFAPRTLQRKLKEAGTSHQELLDLMRQELSIHYLQERQMAVCEVAFLLGFSETSAFHRAFKRWTGTTPGEFRRTLKQSA
ncbi:MAG TPA: AraC family transcriptional regulator [Cyanobacteria bacterium UBA8803]|nr:AraC family transcriptional regulator [Cyanobacteria bacterium UBA9273]HBL61988.1 AraC family transcriptional regulator [Cyanobacteria bacterium UBA8803]